MDRGERHDLRRRDDRGWLRDWCGQCRYPRYSRGRDRGRFPVSGDPAYHGERQN